MRGFDLGEWKRREEKRVRNGKKKRVLCFYVFYVKMKTMIIG